jgi:PleD family two-component response regulator
VIARRIAGRIAELQWTIRDSSVSITATWGIATAGRGSSLSTLLSECDAKLYDYKAAVRSTPATFIGELLTE